MHTLMEIYAREQTEESLKEFIAEVNSIHHYDDIFSKFSSSFEGHFMEKYDAKNINFECLKEVIDTFEAQKGRFTDYGFGKIKYIARACEIASSEEVKEELNKAIAFAASKI